PTHSEYWEAEDMLGRRLHSAEDIRGAREKYVGIFYWTWRDAHAGNRAVNVSEVLDKYPSAEYNRDHPAWGDRSTLQCSWGEPLYGHYRNADPYVIRRHAALLSDAGVDFLMFDCTNGAMLWRSAYEALLRGLHEAREDGICTPKIAFMLNFAPTHDGEKMLRALYQNLYKPGLYSDLWFTIDGKPLIMAYKEALPEQGKSDADTAFLDEIRSFFAFRAGQPLYGTENGGQKRPDHWGWLEIFPQNKYGERPDGSCEMMTVGVGQNANLQRICTHFNDRGTFGRSYTHADGFSLITSDSYKYGYNFAEQWQRALDCDPDIVFVTGWNEWIMGQWKEPWLSDENSTQLAMVDQYNREYSRDIEPDRDGYKDTYYLQLCDNIRRFKGSKPRPHASEQFDRAPSDSVWSKIVPEYNFERGMTIKRDFDGFSGLHYKNDSGRNCIISAKVAHDADNLYFRAECENSVTVRDGDAWMNLFIGVGVGGWNGFEFLINRYERKKGIVSVELYSPAASPDEFSWREIGKAKIKTNANSIVLTIPRELLGLTDKIDLRFKWSDNMQRRDVMDFYENGCAAPLGRFSCRYVK
ncbi:MAG: hypothetical protein WCQ72_08635, partial [Eubacteriales bacterium]